MKQPVVEGTVPPRAYLDRTVVPTLLEGMKLLATERYVAVYSFFELS